MFKARALGQSAQAKQNTFILYNSQESVIQTQTGGYVHADAARGLIYLGPPRPRHCPRLVLRKESVALRRDLLM